jgi:hypothetical protein
VATEYTPAPYSEWQPVLNHLIQQPEDAAGTPCPTCGQKTLHVLFAGDLATRVGFASVWCSTSEDGVISGRLRVPPNHEMVTWEQHRERITPFTVIPAEEIPSDDVETKQF